MTERHADAYAMPQTAMAVITGIGLEAPECGEPGALLAAVHAAGLAKGGTSVSFGEYGLMAEEVCWLTSRQIEAARRAMTHHIKRGGRVWIRVFPDKPVTKKPAEVRMGSGKGSPEFWVARVKPGRILFELDGVELDAVLILEALHDMARPVEVLAAARGARFNVLHIHGRTGQVLEPAPGPHGESNVYAMARDGLSLDLRTQRWSSVAHEPARQPVRGRLQEEFVPTVEVRTGAALGADRNRILVAIFSRVLTQVGAGAFLARQSIAPRRTPIHHHRALVDRDEPGDRYPLVLLGLGGAASRQRRGGARWRGRTGAARRVRSRSSTGGRTIRSCT